MIFSTLIPGTRSPVKDKQTPAYTERMSRDTVRSPLFPPPCPHHRRWARVILELSGNHTQVRQYAKNLTFTDHPQVFLPARECCLASRWVSRASSVSPWRTNYKRSFPPIGITSAAPLNLKNRNRIILKLSKFPPMEHH